MTITINEKENRKKRRAEKLERAADQPSRFITVRRRASAHFCRDKTMVELPTAPQTMSPVPHLTSLHATAARGPFGKANYPGNCSGYLIKDLLRYFQPTMVLDPMTGGGTCRDVCQALGISHVSFDLNDGKDACDPASYLGLPPSDFAWLHPPYWRMIRYSEDPRCLSNAPNLEAFQARLKSLIQSCLSVLTPEGTVGILMGDYFDRQERRQMPITHFTKQVCLELGLWPVCTEIVRFQHGNTSSAKTYSSSFIPGLHDTCLLMKLTRNSSLVVKEDAK